MSNYKLCYISGQWAWFTTAELKDQWGDDWNDYPYEHNAGSPYEWREGRDIPEYSLLEIAWKGPFDPPCDWCEVCVQDINQGDVAWLRTSPYYSGTHVAIHAGESILGFIEKVCLGGGQIFLPFFLD